MPTIIDALMVTLGFDDSKFVQGQADTETALDSIRSKTEQTERAIGGAQQRTQGHLQDAARAVTRTADDTERGSTRAQFSLGKLGHSAQGVSKSFAEIGKASPFLGLLAGIGGGVAALVAVQKLVQSTYETASQGAAVGRAASMSGIDVTKFDAWGKAVKSAGGNAADAEASIASLAMQQSAVRFGQAPSQAMQTLATLGIRPGEDPTQIMKDLASNPRIRAMSAADRTYTLENLIGLDAGSAYAISQGPDYVNKLLAQQSKAGNLTPDQVKTMQAFFTATNNLEQAFDRLETNLELDIMPALTEFASTMTGWVNWLDNKFPKWFHDNITVPAQQTATAITGDIRGVVNPGDAYTPDQQASIDQGMQTLQADGLTKAQAAGVMGNVQAESGFRLHPHDNPNHWGMFQWDRDRRDAIKAHFGFDVDTATAAQQYQAALWEMNNDPKLEPLRRTFQHNPNMSPQEAARIWNDYFERPGSWDPTRGLFAANIYNGALDPRKQPPVTLDSGPHPRNPPTAPSTAKRAGQYQSAIDGKWHPLSARSDSDKGGTHVAPPASSAPPLSSYSQHSTAQDQDTTALRAKAAAVQAASDAANAARRSINSVRGIHAALVAKSVTNSVTHHAPTYNVTVNAPTGNAHDIAKAVKKAMENHSRPQPMTYSGAQQ